MLWVLVISTLLAAIGLLLAWTWKGPALSSTNADNGHASAGPAFDAPNPTAVTRQAETSPAPPPKTP
jgi:hypothetical protein